MANGNNPTDAEYAAYCGRWRAPTKIRITSTQNGLSAAEAAVALAGEYVTMRATVGAWYYMNASDVSTLNGTYLPKDYTEWVPLRGETNVAVITDGGLGYVDITRRG